MQVSFKLKALAFVCALVAIGASMVGDRASDWTVLRSIWFRRVRGETHSERLESFYAPQAAAYDKFRRRMLWAKEPLLRQLRTELADGDGLVWVDLGGGTGSNVEMMETHMPLTKFKAIYIVDLCHSLCEQAKIRVKNKGWENVHVVEADACSFTLPEGVPAADVVTFSYALSMIPNFILAVDQALTYLSENGVVGVCDFYVSAKYDSPSRQMSWFRRFFWQMSFDLDGIFLGSERRLYLENRFQTMWEENGSGSLPYVPFLRAPWYAWVGRKQNVATSANKGPS